MLLSLFNLAFEEKISYNAKALLKILFPLSSVVDLPAGRQGASLLRLIMYFVYVIKSIKTSECYKGITDDLNRRVGEHNSDKSRSTKGKGPWALIYSEKCYDRAEARQREKYLKSGFGRELIKNL